MKRMLAKIIFTTITISLITIGSGCDNKSHHGADAFGGEDLRDGNGTKHHDVEHFTNNAPPFGDSTILKSEPVEETKNDKEG